MIHEIARLTIDEADAAPFEAAVAQAVPIFRAAKGCLSMRLDRVVEAPGTYLLVIGWTSVKAHMEGFRTSPGFQAWRDLVAGYFRAPPVVEHSAAAVAGF